MPFNPYMFQPRGFDPTQDYGISNPIPRMRAKNIFDQPTTPEQNTKRFLSQNNPPPKADFSQPDDGESDSGKYYDDLMRAHRPGPALTAYQAALKEQPTDDNTQVSTSRKIMGTLAGIAGGFARGPEAGISSANEIIDSPYKTAMRDYQVKMKNLGESANLEQDEARYQDTAIKAARDFGLKHDEFRQKQSQEQFMRGIEERRTGATERQAGAAERRAGASETTAGLGRERLNLDTRNINSEIDTRRGQLGVSQQQAGTASRQADTASRQADTAAGRLREDQAYHKDLKEYRNKEMDKVPASQQNIAMDLALRTLSQDREMAPFVKQHEKGFWEVNDSVDKNSPSYQVFKARLQSTLKSTLKGMTPYDDPSEHGIEIQRVR